MTSHTYTFPAIVDPDPGDVGTIASVSDSVNGQHPSFINLNAPTLIINPTIMAHVKVYTLIVNITDTMVNVSYQFFLTVTNQAPVLTAAYTTPFSSTFGQNFNYVLPVSADPEGLPYTTSMVSGPSYVTFLSNNNTLNIYPKNCTGDYGD